MSKQNKVAAIQQVFPHYRVCIFDLINENYNFKLFHGKSDLGLSCVRRDYSVVDETHSMSRFKYLSCVRGIYKFRPCIIVQEFSLSFLNLYVSYIYSKVFGAKFILWGHGTGSDKSAARRFDIGAKVRSWFIRKSDAVIIYNDEIRKSLSDKFGVDKFFTARNSIDGPALRGELDRLQSIGRNELRRDLGFDGKLNICFVSRVTERKRIDLFVELIELISRHFSNVQAHIVGEGPCIEGMQKLIAKKGLESRFVIHGAIYQEEKISQIIFSSDFMFIPGWLGLSANHSMNYGTPVLTLSSLPHPPEVEYVKDGVNGFLDSSVELLIEKIRVVFSAQEYDTLRLTTHHFYKHVLNIDSMHSGFHDAFNYVLSDANR